LKDVLQLTLDGTEVPYEQVVRGPVHARPLTEAQKDILRYAVLNRGGWIRSAEAGRILHAHRRENRNQFECSRDYYGSPVMPDGTGLGCCKHAASDGSEACKRLARRGLLRRSERGVWVTVT
jgi:hypothetical protein